METRYVVLNQKSVGYVRTWDNLFGIGDPIEVLVTGSIHEAERAFMLHYYGPGGAFIKPLLAQIVTREEADYLVAPSIPSPGDSVIWRMNEHFAPQDVEGIVYLRSMEVEPKVTFEPEPHVNGKSKV